MRCFPDDSDRGFRSACDGLSHVGHDRDSAGRSVQHGTGVAAGQGVVDDRPDREPVTAADQAVGDLAAGMPKQPSARTIASWVMNRVPHSEKLGPEKRIRRWFRWA